MAKINSRLLQRAVFVSICTLVTPSISTAAAPNSPAIRLLLDRAKAQAQGGHLDLATATWKQILVSDPTNIEALRNLASAEAQLGDQQEAQHYIERLGKLGASASVIKELQGMRSRPSDADLLKQAASLSRSGQYQQAMEIYRKLYGDNPPAGTTALIYYDTEAAMPSERSRAIEGLRKLVRQFPSDERYPVTLGRVLTYDVATRQEGMELLQHYPSDRAALDALKKAQQWSQRLEPTPPTTASGSAASSSTPSPRPAPDTSELTAGYRALNSGNLALADRHFHASLQSESAHGQGYAGLGFVSMRQQNFDEAVRQFERAIEEGDKDASVTQALQTSRFWQTMGRAQAGLDQNSTDAAMAAYRSALTLKPDNSDALTGMGGSLLRAGQPKEAIPYLQRAVKSDAKSVLAWRSLFLAQSQAGQRSEAVKTAELIPAQVRTKLESDVEFLGTLSTDYAAIGEQSISDRVLQRALSLVQADNSSGTTTAKQLQYASLMMSAKRYNSAARTYRRILSLDPDDDAAWRGIVAAEHLGGNEGEALRAFRQMPQPVSAAAQNEVDFLSMLAGICQSQSLTGEALTFVKRAIRIRPSLSLQLQLASLQMAGGNHEYAAQLYQKIADEHPESKEAWIGWIQGLHVTGRDREALQQIDRLPEDISSDLQDDPDYLQTVASVYIAAGNTHRAVAAMQQANDLYAERGVQPPPSLQIQQGWLWLKTRDNVRLSQVIQQLSRDQSLTADQRTELSQLWSSWALQRASQLRQQGRSQAAIAILSAALRVFPSNPSVNNALADTYLEAGSPKQAMLLYGRQDISQAEKSVCTSAIRAALAAHDRKQAQAWLRSSLDRFGRDAEVLQLAAEFEQQRGDSRRAAAYYQAALQASGPATLDELAGIQSTGGRPSSLPATQELLSLLSSSTSQAGQALPANSSQETRTQASLWPHDASTDVHSSSIGASRPDDPPLPPLPVRSASHSSRTDMDVASLPQDDFIKATPLPPLDSKATSTTGARASRSRRAFGSDDDTDTLPGVDRDDDQSLNSRDRLHASAARTAAPKSNPYLTDSLPEPQQAAAPARRWTPAASSQPADTLDSPSPLAMLDPVPTPAPAPLPSLAGASAVVQRPLTPRENMQQQLEAIQASSSPYLAGRSSVGLHSGQPGFDRLTIFTADVEQSSMIGDAARLSVIVHPTLLQGGTTSDNATYQLGSLPAGAISGAQSSSGVGGELQVRSRSFGAALGYTPHGFLVENVTGRLLIQPDAGPVTFTFDRQPIEDSQLSYAGLRDPGSVSSSYPGNVWGGVISNAASLQVNRGDAASGWYISGGGQYITGQHIRSNYRIDGDAGAYWAAWQRPQYGKLTVGMNLFGMHFANNQRLFTYGNGGYFSPGAYLLSNIPLTFEGHQGAHFHYRAAGSIGLQAFQEGSSPFYPLDIALQMANNNPYSTERTSVGANYNIEGEGSYLMTDHWHIGGFFTVDNSHDYNNSRVGFYLRYLTHSQSLDSSSGPTGLDRSRGLRPLLVP
jgi:tetratricopeptide (TPR) repeat protein